MGLLEDLFKALDRIPIWRRLQTVPDDVDALKTRMTALEETLNGKWPADVCKFCGERAARMSWSIPADDKGITREEWTCGKCNNVESRTYKPR